MLDECVEVFEIFERYTERARQVVVLAQDEARGFKHNYIGTEHILLGLLREEESLAARVLEEFDLTAHDVRKQVLRIVGPGSETHVGQIPFTPRAKKVLELALREALSLGHNYVGTEHLLLGLVRENEGVAASILHDHDINAEKVRNSVIRHLQPVPRVQVKTTAETLNELTSQNRGLLKADSKHKKKIHRLTRELVDLVDRNGRLKYEIDRLEKVLIEIYKHPEHSQMLIQRNIPKKIYQLNLDPGPKKKKKRDKRKEEA